jgi:dihydroflavonol-4-reductase
MILVTGATGLLGNCITRELLIRNLPVRVLCRTNTPRTAIEDLNVEVIDGDLSQDECIDRAVAGCTAVIHSAAMIHIGWQKLAESREVNLLGTQRIVESCLRHQARLVYVSTVDTLNSAFDAAHPISETSPLALEPIAKGVGKIPCSYVVSKRESEHVVRLACDERQLDAVILHPGFMLGPYDWKPSSGRMMLAIRRAPIPVAPQGGCSVCDSRDVASAIVNAIDRGQAGESYILAGENITYAAMNIKRKVIIGGPVVVLVGKLIDAANRWIRLTEGDVNGAAIGMGNLFHYYNSTKAETELNYHRRPLNQTLTDAWQWLSSHNN